MPRRSTRGLLLVLTFALGLVVGGRAPGAWACYCVTEALGPAMARSNLVFTGTAMSSTDPMAGSPVVSSIDPITWTFEVGSTEKGPASGIQLVSTARDGGSCGFSFVAGKRYQVFATRNGAGYSTSLCSGTHDLALAADPFTPSTTWAVFPITVGALALASALAILLDVRRTQRSRVG